MAQAKKNHLRIWSSEDDQDSIFGGPTPILFSTFLKIQRQPSIAMTKFTLLFNLL